MTDIFDFASLQDRQEKFNVDAPYMVWLTAAETQFSSDEKPPMVA